MVTVNRGCTQSRLYSKNEEPFDREPTVRLSSVIPNAYRPPILEEEEGKSRLAGQAANILKIKERLLAGFSWPEENSCIPKPQPPSELAAVSISFSEWQEVFFRIDPTVGFRWHD